MESVFDLRRTNLRKLMESWGGPTSLAHKLGHSNGSYLAQLAGPNPSREVSEKVAREIEIRLNLPPGWLDKKHKSPAGAPDTEKLIEVIALVQDVLDAEGVKLQRTKFTELVSLVYERASEGAPTDQNYLRRLVKLLK